MKALKDKYPIKHLCEAVGISRASYYKWLKRKPSKGEHRLKQLKKAISEVYHHHKGIYGYRRITIYLNHYKKMKVNLIPFITHFQYSLYKADFYNFLHNQGRIR